LSLLEFWVKSGFVPIYARQTANESTGTHTFMMIKPVSALAKLPRFVSDFLCWSANKNKRLWRGAILFFFFSCYSASLGEGAFSCAIETFALFGQGALMVQRTLS